jgi:hypothetical protein
MHTYIYACALIYAFHLTFYDCRGYICHQWSSKFKQKGYRQQLASAHIFCQPWYYKYGLVSSRPPARRTGPLQPLHFRGSTSVFPEWVRTSWMSGWMSGHCNCCTLGLTVPCRLPCPCSARTRGGPKAVERGDDETRVFTPFARRPTLNLYTPSPPPLSPLFHSHVRSLHTTMWKLHSLALSHAHIWSSGNVLHFHALQWDTVWAARH